MSEGGRSDGDEMMLLSSIIPLVTSKQAEKKS